MKKPWVTLCLSIAIATLAGSGQASAATTIGESYDSSGGISCPAGTYVQTSSFNNDYAMPHDGVLTSWSNDGFAPDMRFKVIRIGAGSTYSVVAADGPRAQQYNVRTTNPVRFQVRQGDVIGYHTTGSYCPYGGDPADTYSRDDADVSAGASGGFDSVSAAHVLPIEAVLERDRDGDGFGDETQDGCPTDASTQGACSPPTTLGQLITPFSGGQSCTPRSRVVTSSPGVVSAAPSDGVITSWSHLTSATLGTGTLKLKMFRALGESNYSVVGDSEPQSPLADRVNTYPTRIPVRQGDRIGLAAVGGNVPCSQFTAPGTYGNNPDDIPVGGSGTFGNSIGALDISAVLEADADGDGYGDTSQDLCPSDASTQGACKTSPPAKSAKCLGAEKKLKKAKAKLKKLKKAKAPAKKVKKAAAKAKKAKVAVKKAC